jgi:hypothetical protein
MGRTVRRNENVVWNIVDGESVLLNPETGNYYGLNRTATEIWKALDVSRTTEELESLLASRFNAPMETLSHIEALLDELLARKLITLNQDSLS